MSHALLRPLRRLCAPVLLLLLAASTQTACGGVVRTPESVVEEQIQAFHQHMRWGRYDEAASFLPEDDREDFLDELDEQGESRITEYEIESFELSEANTVATVRVWTQFFALPSTVVQTKTWRERWVYDETLRIWQMRERNETRSRRNSTQH